jgi:hypothetical protein
VTTHGPRGGVPPASAAAESITLTPIGSRDLSILRPYERERPLRLTPARESQWGGQVVVLGCGLRPWPKCQEWVPVSMMRGA